jgi:type II secretory pathway pseudopilin PulG
MTFLELMVTTTILAILSALALPIYMKQLRQAYQTEARINLSGVMISEAVFFSEHRRYSGFTEIGFALVGDPNRYTYRTMSTTVAGGVVSPGPVQIIPARIGIITADNVIAPANSDSDEFIATATADLDWDPEVDQWHVNERREGMNRADKDDLEG